MKSKHASMWIIHIKLKCFFWEETLLGGKRKENIYITGQILGENTEIKFGDLYMYYK